MSKNKHNNLNKFQGQKKPIKLKSQKSQQKTKKCYKNNKK